MTPIRHLTSPPTSNERAVRYLRNLFRSGWYGAFTVQIKDGHVTHVREERTFQANEIPQPDAQESPSITP